MADIQGAEDDAFLSRILSDLGPAGYAGTPPLDMDALNQVMAKYSALPPLEPVRLTREQWEKMQTLLGPPVSGPAPLSSVPVYIVERVEDSTPYLRWLEKLRAAAKHYTQVPSPNDCGTYTQDVSRRDDGG